jgi:NAD(P)-dependent dehydrogenase (short-subunit alcohol dehydrogenase family)
MTRLNGKTALITGSTDGVGRLVAKRLGEAGARVLVHGRNRERGEGLVAEIKEGGATAEFLAADFSALAEVRRLAEAVQQRTDRLDVLINNAGIGTGGSGAPRQTSADGHELRFAVNYLAGFLLTCLLLPLIKQSVPSRIVNVASAGQQPIDFTDVMLTRGYSGTRAYCQSKLAQIIFTVDLAGELHGTGVTVNALHPATYMDTTMVRRAGITPSSSVEEGAEAILSLATSPALEGRSGLYFDGLREARADGQAYDAEARRRFNAISLELTSLSSSATVSPGSHYDLEGQAQGQGERRDCDAPIASSRRSGRRIPTAASCSITAPSALQARCCVRGAPGASRS